MKTVLKNAKPHRNSIPKEAYYNLRFDPKMTTAEARAAASRLNLKNSFIKKEDQQKITNSTQNLVNKKIIKSFLLIK